MLKMTNPTIGILLSQLSGVELHAPLFSDRFDHSSQPLLKALIFALFQIPITKHWFFATTFTFFSCTLVKNVIPYTFVSLCSAIIITSALQETATIRLHDDIPPATVIKLQETRIKSITQCDWHLMCENPEEIDPKIMIFSLRDFLVAPLCSFFWLALQESLFYDFFNQNSKQSVVFW